MNLQPKGGRRWSWGLLGLMAIALGIWWPVSGWSGCAPPHLDGLRDGFSYGLPRGVERDVLIFAGEKVPLSRRDVRARVLKEINYLLLDRRSRVLYWLSRADALKRVMVPILGQYGLPPEFIYLAAIESSYDGRALSSAGAFGYWQFIKSTALCGPAGCDQYDWKMNITRWKDDRADLVRSTHSAARYLTWMNRVRKVSLNGGGEQDGFKDWLLTAAAYNAGPTRVIQRLNAFGATSYWDVPLPTETERYVPRLIALSVIAAHRDFYGLKVHPRGPVAFETLTHVRLKKDLSFAAMARLLDTTPREIWRLNSQIPAEQAVFPAKSGRTSIDHTIHVPKGTAKKFTDQLAAHGYSPK